eukprot:gene14714-20754_t
MAQSKFFQRVLFRPRMAVQGSDAEGEGLASRGATLKNVLDMGDAGKHPRSTASWTRTAGREELAVRQGLTPAVTGGSYAVMVAFGHLAANERADV